MSEPTDARDAARSRALFEAELRAARLGPADVPLPEIDRDRLYDTWASHLSARRALRTAALNLPDEPNFMLKPTLPGGGGS